MPSAIILKKQSVLELSRLFLTPFKGDASSNSKEALNVHNENQLCFKFFIIIMEATMMAVEA